MCTYFWADRVQVSSALFLVDTPVDNTAVQKYLAVTLTARCAAGRLPGMWVRIPPEAWMSVSCECCVLLGTGLCNGLIACPEQSYQVWCVWVCS